MLFLYKLSVNYRLNSKTKIIRYYIQTLRSDSELFNNTQFQLLSAYCDDTLLTKEVNDILWIFWDDSIESIFLEYFLKYMKTNKFTIECKLNEEKTTLKIDLQKMTINGEESIIGMLTE